jgi:hypothetical protein
MKTAIRAHFEHRRHQSLTWTWMLAYYSVPFRAFAAVKPLWHAKRGVSLSPMMFRIIGAYRNVWRTGSSGQGIRELENLSRG